MRKELIRPGRSDFAGEEWRTLGVKVPGILALATA